MIVYKTTNTVNGKIYIGQDRHNDPTYLGSGVALNKAIKKYGKEHFVKEILDECITQEQLNDREKYWIAYYNSTDKKIGYNISLGGTGSIMPPEYYASGSIWYDRLHQANQKKIQDPNYEQKELIRKKKLEDINEYRKKDAVLISPTGEIVTMHGVKAFAREHGLNHAHLARFIRGERHIYHGWKKYIPPTDIHHEFFTL